MKSIQIYAIGIMGATIVLLYWLYTTEREERQRTEANQTSLLEDVNRYKTANNQNVLSIQKLTLTASEFKKYNTELTHTVKTLNLKVKRLQSATTTGTVTTTQITGIVKDSIVFRDKDELIRDTLRCIEFSDGWVTAAGCAINGTFAGTIISRDTLQQFIHRVPRKFIFIKFGTKSIRQEILCSNPHSEIEYSRYITLKK